jgi:hypothetical protein
MNAVNRCKTIQGEAISRALALNCSKVSLCLALVLICLVTSTVASAQSLTVTPSSLNFPNQVTGTTSGALTANVKNTGTTSVTISAVSISPTEFILASGGPITLGPGITTQYKVKFAPDANQTFNGQLTLTVSGGSPVVIPLSGTGIPTLSVFPTSYDFGSVTVGQGSATKNFSVTNVGPNSIQITAISVTPSQFHQTQGTTTGLKPGATTNYQFQFFPDAGQTYNGSFTITLSNNTIPTVIPLSGTGLATGAAVSISPRTLTFGPQRQGTTSPSQVVTITNVGASNLTVKGPFITPPFIVTGFTPPVIIAPGASTTMKVSFFGTLPGPYTGTLSIQFDVLNNSGVSLTASTTASGPLASNTFPTLPLATQSSPYQAVLQAVGGVKPYTWSMVTGSTLPLGLSLSPSGVISGTIDSSVAAVTYHPKIQVVDANLAKVSEQLTLTVMRLTGANCNDITFNVAGTSTPLVPLDDLGTGTYLGFQGGLYPNGSNVRPAAHDAAGVALANTIQPLDVNGNPDPNGIYAFMSFGVSDGQQEFIEFMTLANGDISKNPKLALVNGALFGATAKQWANLGSSYWGDLFNNVLPAAGVSPNQVVATWVQDLDAGPTGTYPDDMGPTQADLETMARNLHIKFPNLKLAYYSSRLYGGYGNGVNTYDPEPFAYENGFAVKGVVQDQINGVNNLNYDPNNGTVTAPWIAWGPYFWANGLTPRNDGLTWSCQELKSDGLHPEDPLGREPVATYLLNFMKTDSTSTPWFLAH